MLGKFITMKKYKLLFLDHTPFVGGAQLALSRHINLLNTDQFNIVVGCTDPKFFTERTSPGKLANIRIVELPFGKTKSLSLTSLSNLIKSTYHVYKLLREEKPDLLVANTERVLYPALISKIFYNTKILLVVRDFEYKKLILKTAYFFVDGFICVSRAVRDCFFKSHDGKASIIYVGTDIEFKEAGKPEKENVKQKLGFSKDTFLIGFVGRLVEWKGPLILPQIAEQLSKRSNLPDWKIIVVGEGLNQEGSVEPVVKQTVSSMSLDRYFRFVGFSADTKDWYSVFDLLLHTSKKPEPFATVIVEALSASVPVIATDLGGSKEVIENGNNGFLVPFDPKEFVQAIVNVIEDKNLLERLRSGAKSSSAMFKEETITKEFEQEYLKLITK